MTAPEPSTAAPVRTDQTTSRQSVLAEQVRLLMHSRNGVPLNLINGVLLAAVVWKLYPVWLISLWLPVFFTVVLARLFLKRAYSRAKADSETALIWAHRFAFNVFAVGCLWGLAGSVILLTNDPVYILFIVFVLGGMMAGGVVSHAAYLPAAYGFLLPTIVPIIGALLIRGGVSRDIMAFMLAGFSTVIALTARNINASIVENFRLRIDQDILAGKLTVSEAAMAQAQMIANVGSWRQDLTTGAFTCSAGAFHVLGLDPRGPPPTNVELLARVHPDDRDAVAKTYARWLDSTINVTADYRVVWSDGAVKWVHAIGERTCDAKGRITRLDVVMQDITERKSSEQKLEFANVLLKTQMEASPDGILVVDSSQKIISYNNRFVEMWSVKAEELAAGDDAVVLARVLALVRDPEPFMARVSHLYDHPDEEGFEPFETTDGRSFDRHSLGLHTADGPYLGRAWFFRDVTDRKRAEAKALRMARSDALTGLANRGVFVEALHLAIAQGKRSKTGFAVIYLDLDHFKDVNDTLGHPIGDELLKAVADRLRSNTREADTVGRFGGDEFALVASGVTAPIEVAQLADKLIKVIGDPYTIAGNVIHCGASIGIDLYGPNASDAETLLSHADIALYRAKADGRGSYRFFTKAMDSEVRKRVTMADELRDALAKNQLFLMYQPQIEVGTGHITGLEALVKWRHPTLGVLGAEAFAPIAEEMGLASKLGHWVLWAACRQAKAWRDAGMPPVRIGINISALQFKASQAFEADLFAALRETDLPASLLELELTETVLMIAARHHGDVLSRLNAAGLKIAVDDFGAGYSSLAYLRRHPVERIKIARTFVDNIETAPGDAAIVQSIIGLARLLGVTVMADGVENHEQFELLKAWGCDEVQGAYFGHPVAVEEISHLMGEGDVLEPAATHGSLESLQPEPDPLAPNDQPVSISRAPVQGLLAAAARAPVRLHPVTKTAGPKQRRPRLAVRPRPDRPSPLK